MNGLTDSEQRELKALRQLVLTDVAAAKVRASKWVRSNQHRRVLRRGACQTVKGLFS